MKNLMILLPSVSLPLFTISRFMSGAGRLLIGTVAMLFALAVVVMALTGAALVVIGALSLTGLILLVVALPFLLPFVVLFGVIILATRHSRRGKLA